MLYYSQKKLLRFLNSGIPLGPSLFLGRKYSCNTEVMILPIPATFSAKQELNFFCCLNIERQCDQKTLSVKILIFTLNGFQNL